MKRSDGSDFLSQTTGSPNAPTAAQLEEMLKQDPNDVIVRFRLGEIYEKQGHLTAQPQPMRQPLRRTRNLLCGT